MLFDTSGLPQEARTAPRPRRNNLRQLRARPTVSRPPPPPAAAPPRLWAIDVSLIVRAPCRSTAAAIIEAALTTIQDEHPVVGVDWSPERLETFELEEVT